MHEDYSNLVGGVATATGPAHQHHHHHNHQYKKAALVSFNKFKDKFISCIECNKTFKSMKTFCGYMRCHPEKY
jgi:predicted transcriptional regulator